MKTLMATTLSLGLLISGGYWATPASAEDYISDETKKAYKIRDAIQKETRKFTEKQEEAYYNKVVNKIVKDAKKEKQIIKKIKLIHDRLAERITYDYDLYNNTKKANEENYWKEGAILNGTAVCGGYADVFRDVLTKAGIKNKLIISRKMDHGWNQVKIGDEYYAIDLTWDDGQDDKKYEYFLLDNKTLQKRGHEKYKPLKSEKATSTKYLGFSKALNLSTIIKEDNSGYYLASDNGIYGINFKGKLTTFQSFKNDEDNYAMLFNFKNELMTAPIKPINGYYYYLLDTNVGKRDWYQTIVKVDASNLRKKEVIATANNLAYELDEKNNKVKITATNYISVDVGNVDSEFYIDL